MENKSINFRETILDAIQISVTQERAAELIDKLEENGVIGSGEGAKCREVLV